MPFAITCSRDHVGIDVPLVIMDIHFTIGLPVLTTMGLPEMAVGESKDRVSSALLNTGFKFLTRHVTIK